MSIEINEIVGFASKASKSNYELYQYPFEWPYPDLSAIIASDQSFVFQQNYNLGPERNFDSGNLTLSAGNPTANFVPSDPKSNPRGVYTNYWHNQILSNEYTDEVHEITNPIRYEKDEISCKKYTLVNHQHWVGVGYNCKVIGKKPKENSVIPKSSRSQDTIIDFDDDVVECRNNEDCRHGQMCLGGNCVMSDGPIIDDIYDDIVINPDENVEDIIECRTDRDCRSGMVCYRNQCIPSTTTDPIEIAPLQCNYNGWFECGTVVDPPEPIQQCHEFNSDSETCNNAVNGNGVQCVWCPSTTNDCVNSFWLNAVQDIFENLGMTFECFEGECGCKDPIAMNYCSACLDCNDSSACDGTNCCNYQYPNQSENNTYGGYIELAGNEGINLDSNVILIKLLDENNNEVSNCSLPSNSVPSEASEELPWYIVLLSDNQGINGEECFQDQYGIHLPWNLPHIGSIQVFNSTLSQIIANVSWEVPAWKPDFGFARTMNISSTDSFDSIEWDMESYTLDDYYSANYWNYVCPYTYCYNKSTPGSENLMRSIDSENTNGNWSVSCDGICGSLDAQNLALNPADNWMFGECYCNSSCVSTFNCCHDYIECPSDMPQSSKVYIWYNTEGGGGQPDGGESEEDIGN